MTCPCLYTSELRIFNGWGKKIKRVLFLHMLKIQDSDFSVTKLSFYWKAAMLICLCIAIAAFTPYGRVE